MRASAGSGANFDPDFLTRSFARTRANLRRDAVDLLLLHEAHAGDATPAVLAWLEAQRQAGLAQALGFSNGGVFGPAAERSFPRELAAQCEARTGVVPELDGGLEPLAAIYPKCSHELIGEAIAQRRLSARGFAEVCLRDQFIRRWQVPLTEAKVFSNWNSPTDLPATDKPSKLRWRTPTADFEIQVQQGFRDKTCS